MALSSLFASPSSRVGRGKQTTRLLVPERNRDALGALGIQAERGAVVGLGPGVVPELQIRMPAIAVRGSKVGRQGDGLPEILGGLAVVAQLAVDTTPVVIRLRVVGIETQGQVQILQGLLLLPFLGVGVA